ncbi:hypothetical protein [Neorhodopirellula lusitana]|uniref:hypothetical protein n=1 Tax=Neorhodopirellula lusitana TaxID=445327 RepID=UPI0024B855A2|nr:hypothetical protein [Neorhodopirellula lusitana]
MNNAIALKHDTIIAMVTRVRLPPDNVTDHPVAARDLPLSKRPARRLGCIGWFAAPIGACE